MRRSRRSMVSCRWPREKVRQSSDKAAEYQRNDCRCPRSAVLWTILPVSEQPMVFRMLLLTIILLSTGASITSAQTVEEPPIPVTMICPYHEDSLRRAYEAGLGGASPFADSISRELVRSNEKLTDAVEQSFTLIFILLGIMVLITVGALRVAYRLKAEFREVRDERRILPMALPEPRVVESIPLPTSSAKRPPAPRKKRTGTLRTRRASPKRRR